MGRSITHYRCKRSPAAQSPRAAISSLSIEITLKRTHAKPIPVSKYVLRTPVPDRRMRFGFATNNTTMLMCSPSRVVRFGADRIRTIAPAPRSWGPTVEKTRRANTLPVGLDLDYRGDHRERHRSLPQCLAHPTDRLPTTARHRQPNGGGRRDLACFAIAMPAAGAAADRVETG